MKSIQKIIGEFGGPAALRESGKISIHIDPFNDLFIECEGRTSPNGLASVSVCFVTRERGAVPLQVLMRFEICDMGWYPYYFRNELEGFEGKVYKLDEEGRIISVDPGMKQLLKEAAKFWDGQLERLDCVNMGGIRS